MKDIEIQSQRKKIECLLLKVCNLSKQLKNKSDHISELDNQIVSLNQKLNIAEEKASQDHIQMELGQSKNCLNQKLTDVEKIEKFKIHVNSVHNQLKPFECKICSKTLKSNINLKQHIDAVHKKMKPHQCQICAKKFSQNTHLKGHINSVHNTDRPFECKICAKRFSQNTHLKGHINSVHNTERPFECKICIKNFATNSGLRKHIIIQHNKLKL